MSGLEPVVLGTPFAEESAIEEYVESATDGPWVITSLGEAQWAMAKYADAQARLAEIDRAAEAMIEQVREWHRQAAHPWAARKTFFEGHLFRYALGQRFKSRGQIKSITVPSGAIRTRSSGPRLVVTDEDAVIEWAKERGGACQEDVIRVKETVVSRGLNEWVTIRDVLVGWLYETDEGGDWFVENPAAPDDSDQPHEPGEVVDDNGVRRGLFSVAEVREKQPVSLWGARVPGVAVEPEVVHTSVEVAR